jgi:spore germination protein GerM
MGRKHHILVIAIAAVVIGTLTVVSVNRLTRRFPNNAQQFEALPVAEQPFAKTTVHLYFADKDNGYLIAEQRTLTHPDNTRDLARSLVAALIAGPQKGLMRTVPEKAGIRSLFHLSDGTLCVDLTEAVRDDHPGGSKSELLTIYSLVDTLVLNLPDVDRVKILVGGRESETLVGHVDLRFPFNANMLLIR